MKKYPKRFSKWYREFGLMNDLSGVLDPCIFHAAKRIAYRAYRRGWYEAKRKYESKKDNT